MCASRTKSLRSGVVLHLSEGVSAVRGQALTGITREVAACVTTSMLESCREENLGLPLATCR